MVAGSAFAVAQSVAMGGALPAIGYVSAAAIGAGAGTIAGALDDGEPPEDEEASDDEERIAEQKALREATALRIAKERQPTGRIVGIIKRNWRSYVPFAISRCYV